MMMMMMMKRRRRKDAKKCRKVRHLKSPNTDFPAPHPPLQTATTSHVTRHTPHFPTATGQVFTCAAISSTPRAVTALACASAAVSALPLCSPAHDCTSLAASTVPAKPPTCEHTRRASWADSCGEEHSCDARRIYCCGTFLRGQPHGDASRHLGSSQRRCGAVESRGWGTLAPDAMPSPLTRAHAVNACNSSNITRALHRRA